MLLYSGSPMSSLITPVPPTEATPADRFAVHCEVLRLSTQPSGVLLLVQFLLDCGVAVLFAWQYSIQHAGIWIALIAGTTAWRGFFPQRLPTASPCIARS